MIHEAAFRNRFSLPATKAAMERANGRRRLARLVQALALHASGSAGTKSDGEDRFLELIPELPAPRINVEVEGFEVDFAWSDLIVEIDGPGHERPRTRAEDGERDARLAAAGYTIVRVSSRGSSAR